MRDATTVVTAATAKPPCAISPQFRNGVFGWRCEPAVTCIKAAVSKSKAFTKEDPSRGAGGATLFPESITNASEFSQTLTPSARRRVTL